MIAELPRTILPEASRQRLGRLVSRTQAGIGLLPLAALLTACATTQPPEPEIQRAQPPPQEIHIHTAPPGAIVDWNGNVLGTTPIVITLTPYLAPYASHYRWPSNGARTQRFRARWPDGAINTELFDSDAPPPQNIAIISPSIGLYRHLWPEAGKKDLQIKKGP